MLPAQDDQLWTRLAADLHRLSPSLQVVARYCLANAPDLHRHRIKDVVGTCGATPVAVVRLAKRYGFHGFKDFKLGFLAPAAGSPASPWVTASQAGRPAFKGKPFVLALSCADQAGIVQAVCDLLLQHGANIEEAAQYHDPGSQLFFMRVQFACEECRGEAVAEALQALASNGSMHIQLHRAGRKIPAFILVSQHGHCMHELLFRWRSGLLPIDIKGIISTHRDFNQLAASHHIPFHHIPVSAANPMVAEARQLEILHAAGTELVVLAGYRQVLSDSMCRALAGRAINIHHSFLTSFNGARPYHQAHDRGVKLIGATAHYVTSELGEGPIIEQDIARADHAMTPERLAALGRDTESQVLARAVQWHAEQRVLINGRRTVVFR